MSSDLSLFLKRVRHLVVIGMGNELRGDDAVGIQVARLLRSQVRKKITVFEGHMMPESFIAPTCRLNPSHVLIVDAAELKGKPGEWRLLLSREIEEGLFTTHAIPTTEVALQIQRQCEANVAFLGIQPCSREVSLSLSGEVYRAAREVVYAISTAVDNSLKEYSIKTKEKPEKPRRT